MSSAESETRPHSRTNSRVAYRRKFDKMPPELYEFWLAQPSIARNAYATWWMDPNRTGRASHRDTLPAFMSGWFAACDSLHVVLTGLTGPP